MKLEKIRSGLASLLTDPNEKDKMLEMLKNLGFTNKEMAEQNAGEAEAAASKKRRDACARIARLCVQSGWGKMLPQLIEEGISYDAAAHRVFTHLDRKHGIGRD